MTIKPNPNPPGAKRVRITDVAPRDGLQNEPNPIATEDKARLVALLCAAGVDEVEVSSFVSPRWIPQLGDAEALFAAVRDTKPQGALFSALVPNEKGMQAALRVNHDAGGRLIDKISVFTAASETFSQRNTNATIAETLQRFRPVIEVAKREGLLTRGYVSCVIACPFEGAIQPGAVADVAIALRDLGVDEIDLGDTIGAGDRDSVARVLDAVIARAPLTDAAIEAQTPTITLHLHDTFGRAGECVRVALERGLRSFDSAAGGLGGCPYASTPERRAPGNVATELLLATLGRAGFETRVDNAKLAEAGAFARSLRGANS